MKRRSESCTLGVVKRCVDFGAFIEIFPGTEGLVHISHLANERVEKTTDVVNEGDEVLVRVIEIDKRSARFACPAKKPLRRLCRSSVIQPPPLKVQVLPHGEGLDLPSYATPGSAGMDLRAAIDGTLHIAPMERKAVPTGLCVAIPKDGKDKSVPDLDCLFGKD